jgi:hypothetical protein
MGLFSRLTGQKLIGTVTIKFYGENEASVEYETEVLDKEQKENDLILLFALYYAKMLYNLDRGEAADQLKSYIQESVQRVLNKKGVNKTRILVAGQKLVEARASGFTMTYSGELHETSNKSRFIQTQMGWGNENYYSSVSTFMFLQYLIDNLPEELLMHLFLALDGMHKYYQEIGDYSKIPSIIEATNYGFNVASQALSKGK